MPWFNLHRMSDPDLRAIYRYVQHLGPAGKPAPDYVPPDKPYVQGRNGPLATVARRISSRGARGQPRSR